MEIFLIIIAVAAIALSIVAIIMASRKQKVIETTKEIVKETQIVDSPFTYDEKGKVYRLNGSLKVDGSISCINKEG